MATCSTIKLCGSVLFVIILQATRISALECYRCFAARALGAPLQLDLDQEECLTDDVPEKFLVTEASSNENFQHWIKRIKEILIEKELNLTTGPSCMKFGLLSNGSGFMFRYIVPEGPKASDLDESGCIGAEFGRLCFCNKDRCNDGSIFHTTENPALQCYGCVVSPDQELSDHNRTECLEDDPPAEFLMNQTTARSHETLQNFAEMILQIMILQKTPMRPGPFCVKVSAIMNEEMSVFRYLIPEAPEAKHLDKSGCRKSEFEKSANFRACFCNHDKCNHGPIVQVDQSSALQCYGCILGADEELSEYNREACLEENPPDELLVNGTGVIPLFDEFTKGLTNYKVNRSEMIKGPFCVKVSHEEERFMFRYIVDEGPDAKYLDESRCKELDHGRRICFCNEDKCNHGC